MHIFTCAPGSQIGQSQRFTQTRRPRASNALIVISLQIAVWVLGISNVVAMLLLLLALCIKIPTNTSDAVVDFDAQLEDDYLEEDTIAEDGERSEPLKGRKQCSTPEDSGPWLEPQSNCTGVFNLTNLGSFLFVHCLLMRVKLRQVHGLWTHDSMISVTLTFES